MPYLVSSIIAIVSALIILMTRYEGDNSSILAEIEKAKTMFVAVDGFVKTYIQSGGDITAGDKAYEKLNFATLYKDGILLGSISKNNILKVTLDDSKISSEEKDKDKFFESQLQFPKSKIVWQVVPITSEDTNINGKDYSSSAGNGYKLFVDFSNENALMSKDAFSENFFGREVCEQSLLGVFVNNAIAISSANTTDLNLTLTGSNSDGKFACIIF